VRGSDPLVFHISGALVVGHGTTSIVTLRAHTVSAKEAWLAQLRAAVAGSSAAEPAKPAAAVLHRGSTGGSEEGEAGDVAQGGVPRKISTAVFPEEPAVPAVEDEHGQGNSGGELDEEEAEEDPEAAATAKLAAEEALLDEIAAQAARRSLRPGEQAVLQAALKVRNGLSHSAGKDVGMWRGLRLLCRSCRRQANFACPALPLPMPAGHRGVCARRPRSPAEPGPEDAQLLHAAGQAGGAGSSAAGGGAAARGSPAARRL